MGDSTEQNGCFKMELKKAKRRVLDAKLGAGLKYGLERSNVVHVVHLAWLRSFHRQSTNRKAIADRGWSPLTYNCLDSPLLYKEGKTNEEEELDNQPTYDHGPDIPAMALDTTRGFASMCIRKLINR